MSRKKWFWLGFAILSCIEAGQFAYSEDSPKDAKRVAQSVPSYSLEDADKTASNTNPQ